MCLAPMNPARRAPKPTAAMRGYVAGFMMSLSHRPKAVLPPERAPKKCLRRELRPSAVTWRLISLLGGVISGLVAAPPAADPTSAPEQGGTAGASEDAAPRPQSPVTYGDIVRAAKKNARSSPTPLPSPVPESPGSPAGAKKGFLGSLAARRRSIKVINGRLL